jgi:hypothetical protein
MIARFFGKLAALAAAIATVIAGFYPAIYPLRKFLVKKNGYTRVAG